MHGGPRLKLFGTLVVRCQIFTFGVLAELFQVIIVSRAEDHANQRGDDHPHKAKGQKASVHWNTPFKYKPQLKPDFIRNFLAADQ